MADQTFNPAGGTREAFNELFQLSAKLDAEIEKRASGDQTLSGAVALLHAELPELTARLTALEQRVKALEENHA